MCVQQWRTNLDYVVQVTLFDIRLAVASDGWPLERFATRKCALSVAKEDAQNKLEITDRFFLLIGARNDSRANLSEAKSTFLSSHSLYRYKKVCSAKLFIITRLILPLGPVQLCQ